MANQPSTVTVTFNPNGNSLTCNPTSVPVGQGNTGLVTVNLQLVSGSSGSIAFQSNPVTWSTTPPTSFNVQTLSSTKILVTAPNGNTNPTAQSYSFEVNYIYTPVNGPVRTGTGDPTIVLDGTGSGAKDHASERGKTHGQGV